MNDNRTIQPDLDIFATLPVAASIFNHRLCLVTRNPAWDSFWASLNPGTLDVPQIGTPVSTLFPSIADWLESELNQSLKGEPVRLVGLTASNKPDDGFPHWDAQLTPFRQNGQPAVLFTAYDVTERAQAAQHLRDRESMLLSVVNNAQHFALYQIAIDPSRPYHGRVVMVSPSLTTLLGNEDPYDFRTWFTSIHPDDRERIEAANKRSLEEGVPYNQPSRVYNKQKGTWNWVHTISTPRFDENGQLTHFNGMVVDMTEQKQAEMALQDAYTNLEQRVQERTAELSRRTEELDALRIEEQNRRRVAEGLSDILQLINSNHPIQEILDHLLNQACRLAQSEAGVIYHFDLKQNLSHVEAVTGMPVGFEHLGPFPIVPWGPQRDVLNKRYSVMSDLRKQLAVVNQEKPNLDPRLKEWSQIIGDNFQAYLAIPLIVNQEVYGSISLMYQQPRDFTQEEIELVDTFGNQAALAIENASLRAQAEENAAIAERNRLARDLHDAVTQSLFSASLLAEVIPELIERDPAEGRRRMEELRLLARGALAEMRTLLLEMRPTTLLEADLFELLRHLAAAFTGKTRVPVNLQAEPGCKLPPEVKVAYYRIAQEALNNVTKYASAGLVQVCLCCEEEQTTLSISDNGKGFDPCLIPPEKLGLGIMKERAEAVGAGLKVTSQPGCGTTILVSWKKENIEI